MLTSSLAAAPSRERDGLVSHILLQAGDVDGASLAVTWVEVAPGGRQRPHRHDPEQVYVVIRGRGRMTIGDDVRDVERGELVFIPPGALHSIENVTDEPLAYVSAATPPMDIAAIYDAEG